jgi:hypothetical protein
MSDKLHALSAFKPVLQPPFCLDNKLDGPQNSISSRTTTAVVEWTKVPVTLSTFLATNSRNS